MNAGPVPRETVRLDPLPAWPLRPWHEVLLILLLPVLLFSPALGYGLLGVDDGLYYFANRALHGGRWPGPVDVWRAQFCNEYFPVTATTLWVDLALCGPALGWVARVHHLLWFGLGALAVWALVRRLTRRPGLALAVALLYVVHPVCLESALWLGQRKNLVAFALAFWSLERYVAAREEERPAAALAKGALAFVLAVLALCGKTHAVALPAMLLAYEVTLGRGTWPRRCAWLAPFALAAGAFAAVNVLVLRRDLDYPFLGGDRLASVVSTGPVLLRYLWHTVAPGTQNFYYFIPELSAGAAFGWLAWALVPLVAVAGVAAARRRSLAAFGWLLGGAALLPALNLVPQLVPMADHYHQWALPGWLLALAVLISDRLGAPAEPLDLVPLSADSGHKGRPLSADSGTRRWPVWLAGTAVALGAVLAVARTPEFHDRITLFQAAVAREPQSSWAWGGYALALWESPAAALPARAGRAGLRALQCPDAPRLLSQERAVAVREAALLLHREGQPQAAWELTRRESALIRDEFTALLTRAEVAARTGSAPAQAVAWLKPRFILDPAYFVTLRDACRGGERLPDALPPVCRLPVAEGDEFQAQSAVENLQRGLLVLAFATLQAEGPERAFDWAALLVNLFPEHGGGRAMLAHVYRQLELPGAARRLLSGRAGAPNQVWEQGGR